MLTAHVRAFAFGAVRRIRSERGVVSFWTVIGGLLLVVAYLTMPDMFHDFFRWLTKTFFDTLHDSFGSDGPNGTGGEEQPKKPDTEKAK